MGSKSTFNSAAATYDEDFSLSEIGMRQRDRVYYWLNECKLLKASKGKNKIFEFNCGTGFDAKHFTKQGYLVVGTDAAVEMIEVAKAKNIKGAQFYQRNFNDISIDDYVGKSDFVFSNFGGLNCLSESELATFFNHLALKQKSRDSLAVVIMPKFCVVEDLYLLLKGQFSQLFRRSRKEFIEVDVSGEKIRTYYHSPKKVKQLLKNNYKIQIIKPIAHFLPPSYLEPFFKKHLWILKYLNFMERTFGSIGFLASNADHFILIAERK